jgi:cation diffusion facilitator CzcD-associated flavoprotein CzcO
MKLGERAALRYLEESVSDPELRRKLVPNYRLGCKRILLSNDYYPALGRDNVELVTDPIESIVPSGVLTRDGKLHELDAIVLATGFAAAMHASPFPVLGRQGKSLTDLWCDGAEAHRGTTIAGFPNFFMIIGPNTGLGHSSLILMIEAQVDYILGALQVLRRRNLKFLDVQADAQDRYNRRIHERLAKTVWATGCNSWYLTRSGKNAALWPGFTFEFSLRMRRFDQESYELVEKDAEYAGSRHDSVRLTL